MSDKDFERGYRMAWLLALQEAVTHLGIDDPDAVKVAWLGERQLAINALREICADFGDNLWSDDLAIPDIIEKHLYRHLLNEASIIAHKEERL